MRYFFYLQLSQLLWLLLLCNVAIPEGASAGACLYIIVIVLFMRVVGMGSLLLCARVVAIFLAIFFWGFQCIIPSRPFKILAAQPLKSERLCSCSTAWNQASSSLVLYSVGYYLHSFYFTGMNGGVLECFCDKVLYYFFDCLGKLSFLSDPVWTLVKVSFF